METFTMQSTIHDILDHPIGKDIVYKVLLQLGISRKLIENPVIGKLTLGSIQRLAKDRLDQAFFDNALQLLNTETELPRNDAVDAEAKWWKEAVFYQIYPRSFKDSNGDGIGDLQGIIEKLDYLEALGVDALWLSPIYDSPNDDNGYDIRDYHKIMQDFGTMADFDALLEGVHERGMRIIMDLVVNHTSDEHAWFQEALRDPNSPKRDYYFIRPNRDGTPPNNWTSFFSGPAWNYYPEQDVWALHLFSKKQMDLNWTNGAMRQEITEMVKWWLDKGIDGFRLDVINYISKRDDLPDGSEIIGDMMGFTGIEHYFFGPDLYRYLNQLNRDAFAPYQSFSVGETPGIGMEMAKLLSGDYRQALDMVFNFDHLETPGHVRFDKYKYDLNYYKAYIMDYMKHYGNHYWMALFFENHDNPRMISKVNKNPIFREALGKLIATLLLTLKGTPFIFQGQEIGMVNQQFRSLEDFRDVESIQKYHELVQEGMATYEAFSHIVAGSRDHARVPVAWTIDGSFSTGEPWIHNDNRNAHINVDDAMRDPHSIYHFYKTLIALRKNHPAFIYGDVEFVYEATKNYFAYFRVYEGRRYFVQMNLSETTILRHQRTGNYSPLLSNYVHHLDVMQPYEINIFQVK